MLHIKSLMVAQGSFKLGPIDLKLEGGITGLAGPNGSGKSTLLRTLAGIIRPLQGTVFLHDRDVLALHPRHRAALFAYVSQGIPAGTGSFTLSEFVAMGAYHRLRHYYRLPEAEVDQALEQVDLADKRSLPYSVLSGGEQRRACLARALVQDSPWILLDEPGSFLDYRHGRVMARIVRRLVQEQDKAVIMVSHDCNLLASLADHYITLKQGHLHALPGHRQFLAAQFLEELYGVPFQTVETGEGPRVFVVS